MRPMDALFDAARSLAALAALGTALEMLLPDGAGRRDMELLIGLAMALGIASLLPGVFA